MNRVLPSLRVAASPLVGASWALLLATSGLLVAQPTAPPAPETDAAASAEEPPRRARDRRRAPEPTEQPAATAAPAVVAGRSGSAKQAAGVEEEIVCKNYKPTGSRMARRLCGTPEQWAALGEATSERSEETMRQMRERASIVVRQPENPLNPSN